MTSEPTTTTRSGTVSSDGRVRPDVRRVLQDLRRFHATGAKSLERCPGRMLYGRMAREAARYDLHPEMLRKARQFAAAYTVPELDRLVASCERRGHAVGLSHVIRLLTVPA